MCIDGAPGDLAGHRLRLVRLVRPVAPQLQRMVLEGAPLRIPARELYRFSDEVCPALQRVAAVVSSDGSFTPPEVSEARSLVDSPAAPLRISRYQSQAIDRTHRIGRTRPVMVYRMIARDAIEEKVVALARRKAALFNGVMDEGDLFATGLTADDIRTLLT